MSSENAVELVGNMHMHTPYSDGKKWHAEIAEDAIAAGLDFVIVTDHNIWVQGVERYYENADGRVLLLSGEEVHNVRREPQASHFLAYGAEKELAPFAHDPQLLIDETNSAGGIGFLAHPFENDVPIVAEPNYGWHDWEIDRFTGLEIWNYMSSLKDALATALSKVPFESQALAKIAAIRTALNPDKNILGPSPDVLAKWDELLMAGKRIVGIGNSDAHGWTYEVGPLKRVIYPYEDCFRAVNTHVLVKQQPTGEVAHDKRQILDSLRRGRCYIGYQRPHDPRQFRYTAQGKTRGIMGDELPLGFGATLQVKAPTHCHIHVIHNGKVVAERKNETNLTYIPDEKGAYRIECHIPFHGRMQGWIYSNPIYLT